MMTLYPSNRAGCTQPTPALTVTDKPPAAVTAKSSSLLYTPDVRVAVYPAASAAS